MEVVIVFVGLFALIFLLWSRMFRPTDNVMRELGKSFGFWRADGWPRGVQEEDPDRPWGAGMPPAAKRPVAIPEPDPRVGVVRSGTPRR